MATRDVNTLSNRQKSNDALLIDAARRMMDAVNMHVAVRVANNAEQPQYIAIRLDDGSSPDNHTLYDNRRDVFRGKNRWARNIMAVKIGIQTMPLREAIIVLQMNRRAFENGVIFSEEEPVTLHLPEFNMPYIGGGN